MESELLQKNSSLQLKIDESLKTIQAEREFENFYYLLKSSNELLLNNFTIKKINNLMALKDIV